MDKDKLKELCRAFVHLNQAVSVALVELNFHSDLSEKDMEVGMKHLLILLLT